MKNRWIVMVGLMTVVGGANLTNVMHAQQNAAVDAESGAFNDSELQQFAALNPIDTHTHIYQYDSLYVAMLQKLHLHILDIMDVSDNANPERKNLAKESRDVFDLVDKSSRQVFACTTFDPYLFNDPGFAKTAIRGNSIEVSIRVLLRSKSGRTSACRSRTRRVRTFCRTTLCCNRSIAISLLTIRR